MITSKQLAAARALLGWTRDDLDKQSGISAETIKKIEEESTQNPRATTLNPIIDAFDRHGVEFIDGGVREKRNMLRYLEGNLGIKHFYNDVATTAEMQGGEFLVYGVNEDYFVGAREKLGINDTYRSRMNNAKNFSMRVVISEDDENKNAATYCEYRSLPTDVMHTASPFYIYGDKLAHIVWSTTPVFIIIDSKELADSFRKQFNFIWEQAVARSRDSKK